MNNLRYADDIVLIAQNTKELKEMAVELLEKCWEAELSLNAGKTKIIGTGKKQDLQVGDETIEVEEVIYLGQLISFRNKGDKEISRRIKKGCASFWGLKFIYTGKMGTKTKARILYSATIPVLTYVAQT